MQDIFRPIQRLVVFLIECLVYGYRVILSPLLIGHCKFVPSCSEYFLQAVREWGIMRGGWLGLKRGARGRPFSLGGINPVPPRPCFNKSSHSMISSKRTTEAQRGL